jgi:acetaldehyde dehydrogenase/alcohol dehydrogenase
MSNKSENLQSEEERQLFDNATSASDLFKNYTTEQITKIFNAVGQAALAKSEYYAKWALEETGYGNLEHKIIKKQLASGGELEFWNPADYIEAVIDKEKKIISYPRPAGIVIALSPCTNPVLAVYSLALQMIATRNAIIICPHPAAVECCIHAVNFLAEEAVKAGAPKGILQVLNGVSLPAVQSLMSNEKTNLVIAIGGAAMVHSAYSSGSPALGVGAANVPCYVHKSADIQVAAPSIIASSSFDYSLPCTTESVVLADDAISDELETALKANGGYFVNAEEEQKLRDFCWPEGKMNPAILGKSPIWIAEQSGFSAPEGTLSLVVKITEIGPQEPVSKEKMWPVLGFKVIKGGVDEAIANGQAMLDLMGKGHSANVYSNDADVTVKFGKAMPVLRVTVNISNALGAGGNGTNLPHTTIIGTGYFGKSSSRGNVTPADFIQWTRIAYNAEDPVTDEAMESAVDAAK